MSGKASGQTPQPTGNAGEVKKRPPKGHRQKGAGTVVVSKGEVKRDGLEIKEWQQTPKQLLLNYCKAEKRPPPRYVPAGGAANGKFLVRVILPDPKDQKEKDIVMVPRDTVFDSQVEAEHAVALLALQRVDAARSHELKLPEPYRSAWLKLVGRSAPGSASASTGKEGAGGNAAEEFTCEECGKGFAKAHALEHHRKTIHPKPKKAGNEPTEDTKSEAAVTVTPSPSPPPVTLPQQPLATASSSVAGSSTVVGGIEKKDAINSSLMQLKSRSEFATEHERQAHYERIRVERERQQRQKRLGESEDDDYVFMSEENRAAIEAIIRDATTSSNRSATLADSEYEDQESSCTEEDELLRKAKPLVDALVKKMHFSVADAHSAILYTGSPTDLSSALDWLLVHLPEDRLPAGFDPRGLQLEVAISSSSNESEIAKKSAISSPPSSSLSSPNLLPGESASTLDLFSWYNREFGISSQKPQLAAGASIPAASGSTEEEEWKSEWEALEATLGPHDANLILESNGSPFAQFRLSVGENPQLGTGQFVLDFRFDRKTYPQTSTPVAILRGVASPELLYACAQVLAEKVKNHQGELSAFTLWDFASHLDKSDIMRTSVTKRNNKDDALESNDEVETNSALQSSITEQEHGPKRRNPSSARPSISQTERTKQNEELLHHLQQKRVYDSKVKRKLLPAHGFRNEIVQAVKANRVVIIKGETGCGKTTQVPQFIFEDMIDRKLGGQASLIITQPRRLAAVSVATRVSSEFGEEVGNVVGYRVQLESKAHPIKTRMEFVTTGLLLRRLQSDPLLRDVTHVIVDEVHERSLDSDFLLALLRECLKQNQQLRIVLMSATMDAQRFSSYFSGVPILEIPGFTYPVREFYLEEVLRQVKYVPLPSAYSSFNSKSSLAKEAEGNTVNEELIEYLQQDIDYNFIARCVEDCHSKLEPDGSILVFMSGVSEITRTIKACESIPGLSLLPLHGALSGPDQRKVFDHAPNGKRKVVVSTNVAETSVTIDDIVCVIDSGRMKEVRFDPVTKMSSLVDTWVSLASARQRKGRAGRVREGICFKLFSKTKKLDADQLAEVHRVPLEQCVLQVASMGIVSDLQHFFANLVDPPNRTNVASAIDSLADIGALEVHRASSDHGTKVLAAATAAYKLSPLGAHLAKLPLDVRLAKMLIFGSLLGVPEDVATVAAALSRRSPFLTPTPEKRELAKNARKALSMESVANGAQSDHLILVVAFEAWKELKSDKDKRRFCSEKYLSHEGLVEMDKLRREFLDSIEHIGFSRRNSESLSAGSKQQQHHPLVDIVAKKRRLVKASLCAGLYPNVVRIKRPSKRYIETHSGALEAQATAKELSFHLVSANTNSAAVSSTVATSSKVEDGDESEEEEEVVVVDDSNKTTTSQPPKGTSKPPKHHHPRVFLHPSSINFESNVFNSSWMVFSEIVQTTKPFVRDCTVVAPYGLLLFGGPLEVKHEQGLIVCGNALKFKASPRIAVLIKEVKKLLDKSLQDKIANPEMKLSGTRVLDACKRLIEGDGFF